MRRINKNSLDKLISKIPNPPKHQPGDPITIKEAENVIKHIPKNNINNEHTFEYLTITSKELQIRIIKKEKLYIFDLRDMCEFTQSRINSENIFNFNLKQNKNIQIWYKQLQEIQYDSTNICIIIQNNIKCDVINFIKFINKNTKFKETRVLIDNFKRFYNLYPLTCIKTDIKDGLKSNPKAQCIFDCEPINIVPKTVPQLFYKPASHSTINKSLNILSPSDINQTVASNTKTSFIQNNISTNIINMKLKNQTEMNQSSDCVEEDKNKATTNSTNVPIEAENAFKHHDQLVTSPNASPSSFGEVTSSPTTISITSLEQVEQEAEKEVNSFNLPSPPQLNGITNPCHISANIICETINSDVKVDPHVMHYESVVTPDVVTSSSNYVNSVNPSNLIVPSCTINPSGTNISTSSESTVDSSISAALRILQHVSGDSEDLENPDIGYVSNIPVPPYSTPKISFPMMFDRSLKPKNEIPNTDVEMFKPVMRSVMLPYLVGLRNVNQICYMNSVLQTLVSSDPFMKFIKDAHELCKRNNILPPLISALYNLLKLVMFGCHPVLDMTEVESVIFPLIPTIRPGFQQDAHEFFIKLIDCLSRELDQMRHEPILPTPKHSSTSLINYFQSVFYGSMRFTILCDRCNKCKTAKEEFTYLSLPLITHTGIPYEVTNIHQCLDRYFRPEIFSLQSQWRCDNCKSFQRATKILTVDKFPELLVLHLSRYNMDGTKLNSAVNYNLSPLNYRFPVSPTMNGTIVDFNINYILVGVVNHHGNMINSGHYTAMCSRVLGDDVKPTWVEYDDAKVEVLNEDQTVVKPLMGYMLFYVNANSLFYINPKLSSS